MSDLFNKLLDNSLASILSAIEIYNKPDFKYRNEVFTILIINSWELLLKAKIIKDNNNNLNSIFIYQYGKPKVSRTGNNLTIDIVNAIRMLSLDDSVYENMKILLEIRDSAVHFYNDEDIARVIYTLGAASIKNYQKLVKNWFDKSLLDYNFYILPLGFSYPFKTISLVDLKSKPEAVKNLLTMVDETKSKVNEAENFFFTCEIPIKVISAKKIIEDPDITVSIDQEAENATVIIKNKSLVDQYPLTYKEIQKKVRLEVLNYNYKKFREIISNMKGNKKYSVYNFRDKMKERDYRRTGKIALGTPCIYNDDAARYIIAKMND